jgi:2EXR family
MASIDSSPLDFKEFALLTALPKELRLEIWEHLLAPKVNETIWLDDKTALCTITRKCDLIDRSRASYFPEAKAHEWDDVTCECNARCFQLADQREKLYPVILRINKEFATEALPYLYRGRTFSANGKKIYGSLHDRMSDAWFLLDRFLLGLPATARSYVRSIQVPMLLSRFEIYGCRDAFYSLASRLPHLQKVHLEVCPSSIREHIRDHSGQPTIKVHGNSHRGSVVEYGYRLGPIMAFADAALRISAVDKLDLGPSLFDKLKVAIEISVWRQLVPLRAKRDIRAIGRIRRSLQGMDHSDVEGLGQLVEVEC